MEYIQTHIAARKEFTNIVTDSKKDDLLNLQMLQCLQMHVKQAI